MSFSSLFSISAYYNFHVIVILILLMGSLVFLIQGSKKILIEASTMARLFRVSEYAIGITIVALSTSLPEMFVSIGATKHQVSIIALGNVVGSNIFNVALIFMLLCIFSQKLFRITFKNIFILFFLNVMMLTMSMVNLPFISRGMGIVFLLGLIGYFYQELRSTKIDPDTLNFIQSKPHIPHPIRTVVRFIVMLTIGSLLLYVGSEVFLNSTRALGHRMGISEKVIAIVFVALGTSLPELMVTITALFNMGKISKNPHLGRALTTNNFQDMAEGNIIGSNILNILGVLGFASIIRPLEGIGVLLKDIVVMSIVCLPFLLLLFQKHILQKITGIILAVTLICYLILLL